MFHQTERWPERFGPESGKACLSYCERLPTWDPREAPWYNAFWPLQDYRLQIACRPEPEPSLDIFRCSSLNDSPQLAQGMISFPCCCKGQRIIVMRLGRIGYQMCGRFIPSSSFVRASESLEKTRVAQMKLAVFWLKTQCLLHVWRGLIKFGLCRQNGRKIDMGFASAGLNPSAIVYCCSACSHWPSFCRTKP